MEVRDYADDPHRDRDLLLGMSINQHLIAACEILTASPTADVEPRSRLAVEDSATLHTRAQTHLLLALVKHTRVVSDVPRR